MTEESIKQELILLERKEYRQQEERVFDFLGLFKKTNAIEWCENGKKVRVQKKGNLFVYRTLIFSGADDHIIKNLYCLYRKAILLKLLEQTESEVDYFKGEQLTLF
ncbi:hypothetical protein [Turicibacter sanguinis]|uniref:hypothetical protein n=1 Tax=Turicibacter sanguinis TaxID=154288 RepID=UPI0018ABF639|nr:hypothetical protein [Turicibacter sanguinis]MDB8554090.1 hypothetical protein [Turicibacter sanguinis]